MQDLESLVARALADFSAAGDPASLENAKARYLGKSGELAALQSTLRSLAPEERRDFGQRFNQVKLKVEAALEERRGQLANAKLNARLAEEALDVTLPGRGRGRGGIHPVIRTWQRIEEIWRSIGFEVADGPEIETDWYNFTALNNPENHPARSMQDTFYVDLKDKDGLPLLLRTPATCRFATRAPTSRRSKSSRPAAPTGSTRTPRTRRCSTRSRACGSTRTSASPT